MEEYAIWHAYEITHGFWFQRLEAATAISGSAICQTWGAKVKPRDLMPQYTEPVRPLSSKQGAELLTAFAEAHNQRQKPRP